jgi:alpha-N-arabinofuranosidase
MDSAPFHPSGTLGARAMRQAKVLIDRNFTMGRVDPRLFGSFIEHLGRGVYGGVYEPGHPTAGERGFRRDVLDLVKELGVTIVRYPGGSFVSTYNFEDGVGPVEARPKRLSYAWSSTEPNAFGTNEFIDWCRAASVEPMLVVNLGTRGPKEAAWTCPAFVESVFDFTLPALRTEGG